MKYFKFEVSNKNKVSDHKDSLLIRFLNFVLPKSNPDFDNRYNDVVIWMIEYDETNNYTNREIGFDKTGVSIVKAPYNKNLGFWTDNDLTLEDFKRWNIEELSAATFNEFWKMELK